MKIAKIKLQVGPTNNNASEWQKLEFSSMTDQESGVLISRTCL
jgi:hypothetical protein